MSAGTVIVLAVLLVAILAGATYMAVRFVQANNLHVWQQIDGWTVSVPPSYGPAELVRLGRCLQTAPELLGATQAETAWLRQSTRVLVWPTATVVYNGQEVSGLTSFPSVSVGVDLQALAHELAHVLEQRRIGSTDHSHKSQRWAGPGGWYARTAHYELWLRMQP